MERRHGLFYRKGLLSLILCAAALFTPASCSHDTREIRTPIKSTYCPPPTAKPDVPYCDVNLDYPLSLVTNPKIYVYKGERRLLLVNGNVLVREYKVGLGPHPSGDKYFQGDGRTPEGEYFICARNPTSKYYKSLGLNYPAPKQAEQARKLGEISNEDYCKIIEANQKMVLPPAGTCLGGAVFIHGGGSYQDWTLGCIAVSNSYMDELFQVVPIGTPVTILP